MKLFNFLFWCFIFTVVLDGCKNKEQEPIPTIDSTNYDEKVEPEVEEDNQPVEVILETKQDTQAITNLPPKVNTEAVIKKPNENKDISFVGHFIYFADAAVFTPCGQKKAVPVQMGTNEYLKLEKSYSSAVEGGTPCFIEFMGKIKKMPSYDGGKKVDMVVIEKLIDVQAKRKCP